MGRAAARALLRLALALALLAGAWFIGSRPETLPASLSGWTSSGPYLVLALGAALAIGFGRGRAAFALLVLALALLAHSLWLERGLATHAARTVYAALLLFAPLDLALLALLPERGVFNRHGLHRLALLGAQLALATGIVLWKASALVEWFYHPFFGPALERATPLPAAALVTLAAALVAAGIGAALRRSAVEEALIGALVALALAGHAVGDAPLYSTLLGAGALLLALGVLQDTFRMAFRDELTGLPSRRALNERLMELSGDYTVAMVDVDHFKTFNDTYGHEVGDQVLKMVAAKLAGVGGGGKAYRYGGEEFTLLFPGLRAADAIPHLEALRKTIEGYRLALRAADRPRRHDGERRRRGGWRERAAVAVTVSVGVAEASERLATPQAVIEAADRALYRAKARGRNRVSR